jgi:hypothetical protein
MDKLFEVKFRGVSEVHVYATNKASAVAQARQYWSEERQFAVRALDIPAVLGAPQYVEAIPDFPYVWLHE